MDYFDKLIKAKYFQRKKDQRNKPLSSYRAEELQKMRVNFYGDDCGYHHKRHCFVFKKSSKDHQDVKNLYSSRREIYRKRKWETVDYVRANLK